MSLFRFKDWIKVRNRVKAHRLNALIKLFLKLNFAFEIVEVFMLLIKVVASS